MQLHFQHSSLDLSTARVMGVLNVTPDSFSDGGLYVAHESAVEHALAMIEDGADIVDVGGESTRPGAEPVSESEELDRVIGVIEALRRETVVPISIDTSKPAVMRAAVAAGAAMVNDVCALKNSDVSSLAALDVPVCLMHMQGEPRTMQKQPRYDDVVAEVRDYLRRRAQDCEMAGIPAERIVLDPGFGFGKDLQHNLALLKNLDKLVACGYPVLVGLSRKSLIPAIMASAGRTSRARDRVGGSVTLALYAVRQGAHIVRVHDVRETVEGLTIQRSLDND